LTTTDKIPPIHPGEILMEDLDLAEDRAAEQIAAITPLKVA